MSPRKPSQQVRDAYRVTQQDAALSRVYQTADRIITGRRVVVTASRLSASGPVAFTNTRGEVTLNPDRLTFDNRGIATMTGANFHELGHVLYTPIVGQGTITEWAKNSGVLQVFNILEDGRVERLLIAQYPSMRAFLTAVVSQVLLDPSQDLRRSYMLVAGRTYLPQDIRNASRSAFQVPGIVPDIDRITGAYAHLVLPRDEEAAKTLIDEFWRLLRGAGVDVSNTPCRAEARDSGGAQGESTQERLQQRAAAGEEGDEEGEGEGSGDDSEDSDSKGSGSGEGEEGDEEGDGDGSGEGESEGGSGAGNGAGAPPKEQKKRISKQRQEKARAAIDHALEKVLSDKAVRASIDSTRRQITADAPQRTEKRQLTNEGRPFEPGSLHTANRVSTELRRLVEAHEPGWEREQSTGRLNVARVMEGRDFNEVFDRWDEGEEGVNLEVVLLVDISGSMCNEMTMVNEAAAILQRALTASGTICSTYVYNSAVSVLYARGEHPRSVRHMYANGGTMGGEALSEAYRVLRPSEARRRLVVMLTDGSFYDAYEADDVVATLQAEGATVAVAYIPDGDEDPGDREKFGHGADVFVILQHANGLTEFTRQVVAQLLRRRSRS